MSTGPGLTRRAIKRVVRNTMESWIRSIDDEDLAKLVERDAFVAGGALASLFLGENANDFDVYFKTSETATRVAEYYVEAVTHGADDDITIVERDGAPYIKIRSVGVWRHDGTANGSSGDADDDSVSESLRVDDACEYRPLCMTGHTITLSGDVQLCIHFVGSIADVVGRFDFVHSKIAYDFASDDLVVVDPSALQCLLSRELVYAGSEYPLSSMFRMRKFLRRGFRINAGQMLRIGFDISRLDLTDRDVLVRQLIGVDVSYFNQLIGALRRDDREIDAAYLATLVDDIFS